MHKTDTSAVTSGRDAHGHAAERAYAFIRGRILRNEWEDGAFLRESELADLIGVSRTPVRDALRRLSNEGLVEIIPNVGTRVREWTNRDLEEIFGLRSQIEGYAARLAATRLTDQQIAELYDLCDRMEAIVGEGHQDRTEREALSPLNERFHALILAGSGNSRLQTVIDKVVSIPLVLRTFTRYDPAEVTRSMAHHREMADAFLARDPDWAESVMRSHLHAGYAVMRRNRGANVSQEIDA